MSLVFLVLAATLEHLSLSANLQLLAEPLPHSTALEQKFLTIYGPLQFFVKIISNYCF